MGSDATLLSGLHRYVKFQSTLPGWGATLTLTPAVCCPADFNPRSPDGERHSPPDISGNVVHISIHAPRMGSDQHIRLQCHVIGHFNPRSPDGERPEPARWPACRCNNFNPRSPDGERRTARVARLTWQYFNPRSPDGERLAPFSTICATESVFQSTLPGWGATSTTQ